MSIPTLAELFAVESPTALLSAILGVANSVGLKATSWAEGAFVRTILTVCAYRFSSLSEVQVYIAKGGFLDYASSDMLTLLADQVYNVQRIPAVNASGVVTFTNSTTGNIVIATGSIHVASSITGKTYTNTTGGTVLASGGTLDLSIVADVAGSASNAGVGDITVIVNTVLGLTCTNAAPVLGADEESDADLVSRCHSSLGATSPDGPAQAYDYVAKTTAGVSLPINRTQISSSSVTGNVSIYLANADGVITAPDLALVQADLNTKCIPLCVNATAFAAAPGAVVSVTATIYVKNQTLTNAELQSAVGVSIAEYLSTAPIGGFDTGGGGIIDKGAIEAAIYRADPSIKVVAMTVPAADYALATGQIATNGTHTITVTAL